MANAAYFLSDCEPTTYISALQGEEITVELYGIGPCDATLQVTVTDSDVASVSEVPVCTRPNVRTFKVTGKIAGTTRIQASLGPRMPIWAETRLVIGGGGDDKLL